MLLARLSAPLMRLKGNWGFVAAAAVPCVVLLVFCAVAIHEAWLISSHQIVVIPAPKRGDTSLPEVPASSLLPLIVGSGALAAMFIYALARNSRRTLILGYLALGLAIVVPYVRRMI